MLLLLYSKDSVIHIYTFIFLFFSMMVYHGFEYSSLCYPEGPLFSFSFVCIFPVSFFNEDSTLQVNHVMEAEARTRGETTGLFAP